MAICSTSTERKIGIWLAFNFFFALAPFVLDALVKKEGGLYDFFNNLFLKREVYIVCTAIIADAFGGLLLSADKLHKIECQVLLGMCFLTAFVTTSLYVAPIQRASLTLSVLLFTCFIAIMSKINS